MKAYRTRRMSRLAALAFAALPALASAAPAFPTVPDRNAAVATIDLATPQGVALVRGSWRYSDARILEQPFRAAGADGQPTGAAVTTYNFMPAAGPAEFDDSSWPVIAADSLAQRRGHGRLSFNWYRLAITVPDRVDGFDTTGSTLVFQTTLDDYAEVWVDGELPRTLGQSGGSVIAGWNAPNRLVLARNVRPGQTIQLAIFGANGPLSAPPTNFIYLREAGLEFHRADVVVPYALPPHEVNLEVVRHDPAIDAIVPANPKLFKLAEGFQFTEGPVWVREGGYLLFSDPNANRIYRYAASGALDVFKEHSGYQGADIGEYRQPGSNGLTLDRRGRLTIAQHGNRRIVRMEIDGSLTTLADAVGDKRFNSPNDLVYKSDGALYFTDPFFGLPRFGDDPRKQLPSQGVYRARNGQVTLLTDELQGPNGIAFSPDEKFLYVGNWQDDRKVVLRFPVEPDGTLGPSEVFVDMTAAPGEDAIDGVKVDRRGNVYVSGPGGLWILSPQGKHLGTVVTPQHAHNMAWGDADGRSLYLTARSRLYRLPLLVEGVRP